MENTKSCIACAEKIHIDAKLCKHCKVEQSDGRFKVESNGLKVRGEDVESEVTFSKSKANSQSLKILGGLAAVILLMFFVAGANSQGDSTAPGESSTEQINEEPTGRWETKCRTVFYPNPNPDNEYINQTLSRQECTDVYIEE